MEVATSSECGGMCADWSHVTPVLWKSAQAPNNLALTHKVWDLGI